MQIRLVYRNTRKIDLSRLMTIETNYLTWINTKLIINLKQNYAGLILSALSLLYYVFNINHLLLEISLSLSNLNFQDDI